MDTEQMITTLDCFGFSIYFQISYSNKETTKLTISASGGGVEIETGEFYEQTSDIKNLCEYLMSHIESLKIDSNTQSRTFITYSTTYKITAYSGDIDDEGGYFTLLFMIKDPVNKIYIGFQGAIDIENVQSFCNKISKLYL